MLIRLYVCEKLWACLLNMIPRQQYQMNEPEKKKKKKLSSNKMCFETDSMKQSVRTASFESWQTSI